jgi:uncharacterized membrane protein YdbT with pleckstrin-like domain
MFCSKCGKLNANDAVYCQKCGVLLEREDETRVAARATSVPEAGDVEGNIFSISPTLLFVKAGYTAAALGAILLVALFKLLLPGISAWIAVLIGMLLLLVPAYFHIRQKLVRYTLTESKIEIDSGLVSRVTRNVPLDRIQDVTVSTSVGQRLLGFGDLIIDNASEAGGNVVLKNIDSPKKHADILLRQMHRRHSVLPPSTSKL